MLHAFVLWLFQDIPNKAHLGFWAGALYLLAEHVLVLVLAYLSYKGIERPAHRLLVRTLIGKR
jgi:peptidoglycan/LPS O-acetylase OafA/YrhL